MRTTIFILTLGLSTLAGFSEKNDVSGSANFDEEMEKKEIIKSINAETENFYRNDYEGVIKYYVHSDYIFHAWNNQDGTYQATIGWNAVSKMFKDYIGDKPVQTVSTTHPRVERRNMIFKFYSHNVAFVTYDEYNSDATKKNFYHCKSVRIMEKQDGLWKIANMTGYWDYKNMVPSESLK
jgi:hypothetical protein